MAKKEKSLIMDSTLIISCEKGRVTEMLTPYKASVEFLYKNKIEKAILKKDKFIVDGRIGAGDVTLDSLIGPGNHLIFTAHTYDHSKTGHKTSPAWSSNGHNWLIISAYCVEHEHDLLVRYNFGLFHVSTKTVSLGKRQQGILSYQDHRGNCENILFLGSKVSVFEHKLNTKHSLDSQLELDDKFFCDAIPCDSQQNDSECKWFATTVWRGLKPDTLEKYASSQLDSSDSLLRVSRALTSNSRTVFVRGRGQVMSLLGDDFGLALIQFRINQWFTVLFHKSVCFIKGQNLGKLNLQTTLKEGDAVRLVCVAANKQHPFKFIACQVSLDVEGTASDEWPPLPPLIPIVAEMC